jgi:hypothetical protein
MCRDAHTIGRGIAALQSLNCDRIKEIRRYDVGDTLSAKGARTVSDRPRHGGAVSRHGSLASVVRPRPGLKRRLRDECKDLFLKKL